ncbi:hypothetical protein Fmac_009215 [Flemingia macrophylla]|uniref:Uncharacterized protein n=1 Tax=Flemingia macrophylla TaxID=520843 RepID=A0ABD1MZL4_9FABA
MEKVGDASVINILKELEALTTRVAMLTWSIEGQVRSSNATRKNAEKEVSLLRKRVDKLANNVTTLEEEKQLSTGEKARLQSDLDAEKKKIHRFESLMVD